MTCRSEVAELLPFYAAGSLDDRQTAVVDAHLTTCPDCREELRLWHDLSGVVAEENACAAPSPALIENVLAAAKQPRPNRVRLAWTLVRMQVPLLRREIWFASALIMAIGYFVALCTGMEDRAASVVVFIAPLITAAGVAMIYGSENDPCLELALATPTSPRQVLLARLVLVFAYDLALSLIATLGLVALVPMDLLGTIILAWLGPMTFLCALALVLSLSIGTNNALAIAAVLWVGRWIADGLANGRYIDTDPTSVASICARFYEGAWTNSALLYGLAAGLLVVSAVLVVRDQRFVPDATR